MKFDEIINRIEKKIVRVPDGEERISKVINGESADYLPLIFWRPQNVRVIGKSFNMKEQFYDKEKMLYAYLEEIEECAPCIFDAPICIRPNFGTIFIPAIFNLKYEVFEDKFPWLTSHLSNEEISRLDMPDIKNSEIVNKAIDYMLYFKENIPQWIHVYLPDTQGPFDIAHLVYGDDIFLEIYDDPSFVHHLLNICTEVYIEVSKILKNTIGEPLNQCYHGHALIRGIYMKKGGVRISEDSATLISPKHIEEFVIPYIKKALEPFEGGFIHFCGKNEYFLDILLDLEEVYAINLGNPEIYDFYKVMKKIIDNKKCYFGLWPKGKDESLIDYIRRMISVTEGGKRGLILLFDESMYPEYKCEKIYEIWREEILKC